jgi:hypothetical protein
VRDWMRLRVPDIGRILVLDGGPVV